VYGICGISQERIAAAGGHISLQPLNRSTLWGGNSHDRPLAFRTRFDRRKAAEDTARFFAALSGLKHMRTTKKTLIENNTGENT